MIRRLYQAWFGHEVSENIGGTWRAELDSRLCAHEFLAALLGALNGAIRPVNEVSTHLQRSFPELGSWSHPKKRNLLQGFMALLAFARSFEEGPNELRPFLSIRIHFWIRELKRMVVSLPPDPDPTHTNTPADTNGNGLPDDVNAAARNREANPRLLHSDNLPDNFGEAILPVIHCRECAGTAWVTAINPDNSGFVEYRNTIYQEYFAKPCPTDWSTCWLRLSMKLLFRKQKPGSWSQCLEAVHFRCPASSDSQPAETGVSNPEPPVGPLALVRLEFRLPVLRSWLYP